MGDPIDSKGKKAKPSVSIIEQVESSKITQKSFYCTICLEPNPSIHKFIINPCNHMFCHACINHYVTSKVEEKTTEIHCPYAGCDSGILDPLDCQEIVSSEVFERWNILLCESLFGLNKVYCAFSDCAALLFDECNEGCIITNSECPHCHRMFCARCKVPWHAEMSCDEFENLGKGEREAADLMLINLGKNRNWQRCPQCRMYVEKDGGCMLISCRCGYCFCYVCASLMSTETHYCATCKR